MEYITSKSYVLPDSSPAFAGGVWFNLWSKKFWPYQELLVGDRLYWYETPSKRIVWDSTVVAVGRLPYRSKDEVRDWLITHFGAIDVTQDYFVQAADQGYCLAYLVEPRARVSFPKPDMIRFPQLGWERVTDAITASWIPSAVVEDTVTLDDQVDGGTMLEIVQHLNAAMTHVAPERVRSVVARTLRRDTALVRALKALAEYQCQFSGCGVRIPKRDGGYYIEVAHILPVREGGRSIIGNLLVLCPNHHKAFDYGHLDVTEQTDDHIRGTLSGLAFDIQLPGA